MSPWSSHPVGSRREARGWSQAELARRAGLPRSSVGAVEARRLTPSVSAALALAGALGCSVEELFGAAGTAQPATSGPIWADDPAGTSCRYWEAELAGRRVLFAAETAGRHAARHDGLWVSGVARDSGSDLAEKTLVLACCDPAAGLLASEYAENSGFRLLVLSRGSTEALSLLRRGMAHVAGLHRSTVEHPELNRLAVRGQLGTGFQLVRAARWQAGVALAAGDATRTIHSALQRGGRWALRESGSAARECLDSLSGGRRLPGRVVRSHAEVAEAVRAGWAQAGVCVKLCADEAHLGFLSVRTEVLDFCVARPQLHDPRVQALIRLLRSRSHRRLLSELPGYDASETGEMESV